MSSEKANRLKALCFAAIFWLALLITPLLALEGLVRAVGLKASDDPYIHFGRVLSFFDDVSIDGVEHKRVKSRDLYRERMVSFAKQKPAATFRIFCIGSSASAGWPHPKDEIYSAYLESALKLAYPNRAFEVLNVSADAFAAYRQRMILREILPFQPDLIIIYSGNNEFLEPRRYSTRPHWYDPVAALAKRSTVYELFRGSPPISRWFPGNTFSAETRGGVPFEEWSKIEEVPLPLRTNPDQFEKVVEHYRFSITSMLHAAKNMAVPVLLLTVPTNLRDWQPNVSTNSAKGDQEKAWRREYMAGRAALLVSDIRTAIEALRKSASLDPGHAATHFYLGRAMEADGRLDEAYTSYIHARDLDSNPFRAISRFNDVIRRAGEAFDNVTVVDMESHFRAAAHPLAPGFDLFLDYVHPTKNGNLVVAKHVFDALVGSGLLEATSVPFQHVPKTGEDGSTYDEAQDAFMQEILLRLAMMMHQNHTVVSLAERILASPDLQELEMSDVKNVRTAHELFPKLLDLERRELLADPIDEADKNNLMRRLNRLYGDTFENYLEYQSQRGHRAGRRRKSCAMCGSRILSFSEDLLPMAG